MASSAVKVKERSKIDSQSIAGSVFHNSNHTVNRTDAHSDLVVGSNSERISYTTGTNRFNMCSHERHSLKYEGNVLNGTFLLHNATQQHYHEYRGHHNHSRTAHAEALAAYETALQVESLDLRLLAAEAMDRMKPDLTVVSVPNFLLEIKDWRRMFDFWRSDRSFKKNVAGMHLGWNFGWKPFISDCQKIYSSIMNIADRLNEWEKSVESGNLLNRSCDLSTTQVLYQGQFNYGGIATRPCVWSASHVRTVTGHCRLRPLPFKVAPGFERILRAHLQALGIAPRASIIWEALPLSFVVDWFFDVQKLVKFLDFDTLELPFILTDFCLQSKVVVTVNSQVSLFKNDSAWTGTILCPPWTTRSDYFNRHLVYPDRSDLFGQGWKVPTGKQASLGVSLIVVLSGGRK